MMQNAREIGFGSDLNKRRKILQKLEECRSRFKMKKVNQDSQFQ